MVPFPGLVHRMETVGEIEAVRFVNDSKATNADAARQAMSSYPRVEWSAGGRATAGGLEPLEDLFPASPRPIWWARRPRISPRPRRV